MKERKIDVIFAGNVVYFRKKLGFSQADLAAASGISRTMISHYEREGMIPPAERLQTLADSLKIPVYKLFKERQAEQDYETELQEFDPRSIKKLRDILSLPAEDRNDIYRILNKMLRKNQLEKQVALWKGTYEKELLTVFNKLTPETQEFVLEMARNLLKKQGV